jgi:hypothetical protein
MKKIDVLITGAEHSGTRFMWALMNIHPNVNAIHSSIPSDHQLKDFDTLISEVIIIYMVRDKSCTLKSQLKNNSLKDEHLERMDAKDAIEVADRFFIKV